MTRLILPLAALVALVVAGCAGASSGGDADGNGTDRAFAAAMVPHHESAVQMADIAARRASSSFVRDLAAEVRTTQRQEIDTLRTEDAALAREGVERGELDAGDHEMGMPMNARSLETARSFDAAFIRAMIPHHEGAVAMAKAEIASGSDPELKRLAERIVAGQSREIEQMRARL
jgi:uncharacterized protein (DUF305 family)